MDSRRLDERTRKRIGKLASQGVAGTEIAKALRIHKSTVYEILRDCPDDRRGQKPDSAQDS
jgi:IS30 family transposase